MPVGELLKILQYAFSKQMDMFYKKIIRKNNLTS